MYVRYYHYYYYYRQYKMAEWHFKYHPEVDIYGTSDVVRL
jgi:hypothetical protein